MIESFELGDITEMKKPHACGGKQWEIIRTGADVKIKCRCCGHIVMLTRQDFLKKAAKLIQIEDAVK